MSLKITQINFDNISIIFECYKAATKNLRAIQKNKIVIPLQEINGKIQIYWLRNIKIRKINDIKNIIFITRNLRKIRIIRQK
jgi:hypothetical protein